MLVNRKWGQPSPGHSRRLGHLSTTFSTSALSLFRRRRACIHPEVSLTASVDRRTALVACTGCTWRVVAALPAGRASTPLETGTAVMVDAHAFEQLRLGAQIETIFTDWSDR